MKKWIVFVFFYYQFNLVFGQSISGAHYTCVGPHTLNKQLMGFVSAVYCDSYNPNFMYVGSLNGGLWKGEKCTIDGCDTTQYYWKNISDTYAQPGVGVIALEVAPNTNGQTIYIGTQFSGNGRLYEYGCGILKTTNGGKSWQQVGPKIKITDKKAVDFLKMNTDDPKVMLAYIDKRLYLTFDGWQSFEELNSPIKNKDQYVKIGDIAWKPGDTKTFYLSTRSESGIKSEFYVSKDAGKTFTDVLNGITASNIQFDVWRKPGKENFLFVAYGDAQIYYKLFDGVNWSAPKNKVGFNHTAGSLYWNMELEVNDEDTSVIYISTTQLSKSVDGGKTFKLCSEYWGPNCHADIRDLKILKSTIGGLEDVVCVGNDGGISISKPGLKKMQDWKNMNGYGLAISQFWGLGTAESFPIAIAGGGQDNGLYAYDGTNWTAQAMGVGDGYDACFSEVNTNYIIGQGNSPNLALSIDGGNNWKGSATPNGPAHIFRRPMFMDKTNNTLWLGHHQLFMKNNTKGLFEDKWVQKSFLRDFKTGGGGNLNGNIYSFAVSEKNNNSAIIAYYGAIWQNDTLHGKLFWTKNLKDEKPIWIDLTPFISHLNWREVQDVVMDNENEKLFYLLCTGPYDGFDTEVMQLEIVGNVDTVRLINIDYNLPKVPCSKLVLEKGDLGNLYLATDSGIYFTNKKLLENTMWLPYFGYKNKLPFCNVSDMEINYTHNALFIATYGRGVWKTPLAETGLQKRITIKRNTVWVDRKKIDGELIVNAGKTLTISNITYITSLSKITLKKGAKLIVKQISRNVLLLNNDGSAFDVTRIVKAKGASVVIDTQ